jgi:hypothetical protein
VNPKILSAKSLWLALLVLAAPAVAQTDEPAEEATPAPSLEIQGMVFARDYDPAAKTPVESADTFPADVGRVICFTRVIGAAEPTTITHAWYHEGNTMAKVDLDVGSASWRTYSSKNVLPSWTGSWEVRVLDASGVVLASKSFTIE